MPLHDFHCTACGHQFEALVRSGSAPACPHCASTELDKCVSRIAPAGKIEAIRYAREHGLPFFGICLGLQMAVIEFARNVCGLDDSNSSEFAPECSNAVISLLESQQNVKDMGGTMRLGTYACRLKPGSKAAEIYRAIARRIAIKIAEKAKDMTSKFPNIVVQNT